MQINFRIIEIKNLFLSTLIFTCCSAISQVKVDGLLSINEFYGKVVSDFDGNYFWVKHNSKYHIYNKKGVLIQKDIVLKSEIDIRDFQKNFHLKNDVLIEYDKGRLCKKFVSLSGNKNIKDNHRYSAIIPYDNGTYFAIRELDKQIGKKKVYLYLDKNLNVIYKIKPDYIDSISKNRINMANRKEYNRRVLGSINNGLIRHYNPASKKFGFINTNGKLMISHKYKAVGDFSGGLAFFQNDDNLFGYINTKGEIVIPAKYSKQPYSFFSDRARVLSKDGYWGFIDKEDQLAIEAKYKYATNFYKNHALVRESKFSPILLIDATGNVVTLYPICFKLSETTSPAPSI